MQKESKYEYELLSKSTKKYDCVCYDIAFNRDASVVVAGCDKNIKVFEFKNEQFKEIQELKGHTKTITCLLFTKKSNQFISGSHDNQIKIWRQNNNQWINADTLIGHKNYINCLIINQNDDLIISASEDISIIFWILQNKKWNHDQQIKCLSVVSSFSLNHSNTKLIAALFNLVEVFEYQISKWCKVQEIDEINCFPLQLCFINDSEFLVSHKQNMFINFYSFNQTKKQFEIVNKFLKDDNVVYFVELDYLPIQYFKSKNLLLIQQHFDVNVYRKLENNKLILNQSIGFETRKLYGCVSDDGQYLLILDPKSKELQVRKLKMIMQ